MSAATTAAATPRRSSRRPLLDGRAAARAWEAIEAIAREIPPPREDDGVSPDLARGHAGRALFFAYLGAARGEAADRERALAHLDAAADGLARVPLGVGLLGGFTGVAWTLRHLASGPLAGETVAEDATEEIDELLLGGLESEAWNVPYELVEGLAGIAIYALEGLAPGAGLPSGGTRRLLSCVVDRLEAAAEPRERGVSWFTPPEHLPEHQRSAAPEGYYNCGVAHGVPAALVALARCRAADVEPRRTGALAAAAGEWLLAQRQGPRVGSDFPGWVGPGIEAHATRLAWCYGDPGVAAALAVAAGELGRGDWLEVAAEIALRAAARPPEQAGIEDAGLCHGAAGLGHLLHRLYRATGEPALAAAAGRWLGQAVEMREPGLGVGGYRAWEPSFGGWQDDAGLLVGAAGVGLALLAAVTPGDGDAAGWDRALACSGSPAGGGR